MDNNQVTDYMMEMRQAIAMLTEQMKGAFKRIDEQKQLTQTVQQLALSLRDLTNAQKNATEAIKVLRSDVDELRQRPAKRLETAIAQSIALLVSALVGGILTKLF